MAFSSQKLNFKRQRPADDSKQGKGFGRLFRYAVTSSRVCPLSLVLTVAPVQEALAQALPALLLPTSGPDCHPRQLLLSQPLADSEQASVEELDCTAAHALTSQGPVSGIPRSPQGSSEQRMAALLAGLQRPDEGQQPFWHCSRSLRLIAEINQLRGLPGPRAAALAVRHRNIMVLCLHPDWQSILPWNLTALCRAIAHGELGAMFPLTVIGQRQLIPLGALCSIDPHLVYHTVVAGMSAAVEACNGSKLGCLSHLSRAEIFDKTEDLLTADALRLEIDLSLTMGLIHSVFTSFQVASFLGAIYPYFCDWIVLAKLLAAQPLPPA
ncbi:hypothetical protein WJX74_010515 [Apatococcus lobatus]|uniref:Uncharacterized protein n=1 Tax=Apatococcus lobatus TaxID=904363 RepID=A0AAW1Q8F4_9CHLO